MNYICGDITPKIYQDYTITGLYVDIVQSILYFTSTNDGKYNMNPVITVTNTTEENNLKYGIELSYKNSNYYTYISTEELMVFTNATTPLKVKIEPSE